MNREQVHAQLRAHGWGSDLDALIALLESHKVKLNEVVAIADNAAADPIGQRILNTLAGRAKAHLRVIESTLDNPIMSVTHGDLGRWGKNGNGPLIDDILRSAEIQARLAAIDFDDSPKTCPQCESELENGVCLVGCDARDTLLTEVRGDPMLKRRSA